MKKSITVGLLIPTLHKGGAEKIAAELSKALPKEWKKYIIVFEKKISYEYEGELISLEIPMENRLKEIFLIPKRAKELRKIVEDKKIDVVMSFDEIASFVNLFSKSKSGKIVAIRKSLIMADKQKGIISKAIAGIVRKQYNKACKTICVSQGIKKELISYVRIKKNKVKVLYNIYDIKNMEKLGMEKEEIDLPNKYLLNIGRAEREKGQWHLIRAFKKVKEKNKDIKLVIIATGSLLDYLKKLRKELGLEKDVVITDIWINNVYPILKKAEAFVLSSLFEGFPNVLVEALTLERAIISTNCNTGPKEIVGRIKEEKDGYKIGERGILVEELDGKIRDAKEPLSKEEEILANAMLRVVEDKKLRREIAKNGKNYVKEFDKNKTIKEYVRVIEECSSKKKNH